MKTHGMKKTPEYTAWKNMKARCNDVNHQFYSHYGARGIKVCDSWNESFVSFFNDMGFRPTNNYSLDRIDNNKGYSPENCKWSTKMEQVRNRRDNLNVEYNGTKHHSYQSLADAIGIKKATLWRRMKVHGFTLEQAVNPTDMRKATA